MSCFKKIMPCLLDDILRTDQSYVIVNVDDVVGSRNHAAAGTRDQADPNSLRQCEVLEWDTDGFRAFLDCDLLNFDATTSEVFNCKQCGHSDGFGELQCCQSFQAEQSVDAEMPSIIERAGIKVRRVEGSRDTAFSAHCLGQTGADQIDFVS